MASTLRLLRWTGIGLIAVLLVLGGLAVVLLRSQPGYDLVLRTAVNQLPRYVNGQVEVGALRSEGLLRGFTLHAVAIRDHDGRPLIEADSIRVRYSFRDLVRRNVVIVPAEAWGPKVTIETLHGDTLSNVARIFPASEPADPRPEPTVTVALRQVEIHEGEVLVRIPIAGEAMAGGVFETTPAGEVYQVLRFAEIEARLEDADLLGPELDGERFRFDRLSFTGHVLEEPFRLEELRGEVARQGSRLSISADRIWFPGSELAGRVVLDWSDPDALPQLEATLEIPAFRLADFRWLEPRLPDGEGALELHVSGPLDQGRWRVTAADIEMGGSRVRGALGFDLGEPFRLVGADLELLPFELALLEPFLEEPLPVEGRLRGTLRAEGPVRALVVRGDLEFDDPARNVPPSTARFDGLVDGTAADVTVTDFSLTLDPLRYETLRALLPELELSGAGRIQGVATGSLSTGLILSAEAEHRIGDWPRSRVTASGRVQEVDGELLVNLTGRVDPVSLDGIGAALGQELPVAGVVFGDAAVSGPIGELSVSGRLMTPAGLLDAVATFDARDPARAYRTEGSVEDFRLHTLVPALPDPTIVSGGFFIEGQGADPETFAGSATLNLRQSEFMGAALDRLDVRVRGSGGRLLIDELELSSAELAASGTGELALRDDQPPGEMTLTWELESLAAIRPIVFRDGELAAADTLSRLERDFLVFQGVDPDTLDTVVRAALEGRAHGGVTLRGGFSSLTAEGFAELEEARFGQASLAYGHLQATGRWERDGGWGAEGLVEMGPFSFDHFQFAAGSARLGYQPGAGEFAVDVLRDDGDAYRASGSLVHDSLRVEVALDALDLELEDVQWSLVQPTRIEVQGSAFRIDDLRIARPPGDVERDVRIEVRGLLDLDGESDLLVELEGVDLDRLARVIQTERLPAGMLDLRLEIRGPFEAPRMEGALLIRDFALDGASLSQVEGTVEYADRVARARLLGERDGQVLLIGEGRVPIDLSFREVAERLLDEEIDVTLELDALPAATAFAFLEILEEVEGTLDGAIHIGGTARDPRPTGEFRLRGGSMLLLELGIRPTGITADVRLRDESVLEIQASAISRGTARIAGAISLADPADPAFNLAVTASGFQAVDRRDLQARLGGEVTLRGSYTAPRVAGTVRVETGELFVEEFARTAEVIDLTDPAFFDVVDTTLVAVRPVVEAAQNPFLQNLRVDVDLAVQRDFWLRSRDMNAEMSGDLIVTFDRPRREILLVGSLEAVRGTYSAFGRHFRVQGGNVEFIGTPGIDPDLDIEAVTRLRQVGGEPLDIRANLQGTLLSPRVQLSTDAQPPISESDLISYLIFGRPSYALASGETSILQGAAGAGVTMGIGTIATQLGSVVAQQFGVDYFTITQEQDPVLVGAGAGFGGTFAETQIEVGQYVGENLFLALVLRPLTGLGASTRTRIPGARLEWRFTDDWSLEGFVEDRFAREGTAGFGDLGLRFSTVLGFYLYREWGY